MRIIREERCLVKLSKVREKFRELRSNDDGLFPEEEMLLVREGKCCFFCDAPPFQNIGTNVGPDTIYIVFSGPVRGKEKLFKVMREPNREDEISGVVDVVICKDLREHRGPQKREGKKDGACVA